MKKNPDGGSIRACQLDDMLSLDIPQKGVSPLELARHNHDSKRYAKVLADCCYTITNPF